MTQDFSDDQPLNPYETPRVEATSANVRPTAAVVFGILNILFGVMGVFGILVTGLMMLMPPNPQMPNPALDIMRDNQFYSIYSVASLVVGSVFIVVLIVAGIGLLKFRPFGRTLSIVYGVYAVLSVLIGTVINYVLVFQPLLEQASELPGPQSAGAIGGVIGGVVGSCFGLIYPVLLLCFMFRPSFSEAFKSQEK